MRWNRATGWYFVATLVLIAGLTAWFSLQSGGQARPRTATARTAATDPEPASKDASGPSVLEMVGLTALLVIPIGAIVIIVRLQRRRKAAYRDAARIQKEEARAAEITANRRDQNRS